MGRTRKARRAYERFIDDHLNAMHEDGVDEDEAQAGLTSALRDESRHDKRFRGYMRRLGY